MKKFQKRPYTLFYNIIERGSRLMLLKCRMFWKIQNLSIEYIDRWVDRDIDTSIDVSILKIIDFIRNVIPRE